jgi:hypothetical protein
MKIHSGRALEGLQSESMKGGNNMIEDLGLQIFIIYPIRIGGEKI